MSLPTDPPVDAEVPPRDAPPAVRRARLAVLLTLALLAVLCVAWELWLAPTGRGTLALKALPLALCVAGVLRHRLYTYRWLSLLVWLYVTEGLVRATSEQGLSQALAAVEVLLSTTVFVCSVHYIRLRLPRVKKKTPT